MRNGHENSQQPTNVVPLFESSDPHELRARHIDLHQKLGMLRRQMAGLEAAHREHVLALIESNALLRAAGVNIDELVAELRPPSLEDVPTIWGGNAS